MSVGVAVARAAIRAAAAAAAVATLEVVGSVVVVDGLATSELHGARAARAVAIPVTLATCPSTRDHLPPWLPRWLAGTAT